MGFNSKSLKVLFWNIRGLNEKLLDQENQGILFKNDIVILTETHSAPELSTKFDIIPGFKYFDFPRTYRHPLAPKPSGGIGIFVKTCLIECLKVYSTEECIVWINLQSGSFGWERDKLICCVYFSPSDSSYLHNTVVNTDYFNILNEQIACHNDQGDIFLCGDLNARTGQLQDMELAVAGRDGDLDKLMYDMTDSDTNFDLGKKYSQDMTVNTYGRSLIDLCKATGLRIMNGRLYNDKNVGECTYESCLGKSTIDLLICKPSSIPSITDFSILSLMPTESDHKPVFFSFHLTETVVLEIPVDEGKAIYSYKWNPTKLSIYLNNYESDGCQKHLDSLLIDLTNDSINGDYICNLFYKYIESAIEVCFKKRTSSVELRTFPNNTWFDEDCKLQKRIVNDYCNANNVQVEPYKSHFKSLMVDYNRIKQKKCRLYRKNIRNKLKTFESSNPCEYWTLWKSFKRHVQNHSKITLRKFDDYFGKQVKPPDINYFDKKHMSQIEDFMKSYDKSDFNYSQPSLSWEICNGCITLEEVIHHIDKLKLKKASGIDGIPSEFIKSARDQLSGPLHGVFNFLFNKGEWPAMWAEGLINPIHKKGSQNTEDNYRKVTVMPALGKVFESILNTRLTYRNLVLDMDDRCQFGFKQDARTTDNMFILNSLIQRQKFRNKPLYVCFVDFTKAFDYINRSALYYKLIKRGIHGKLLNIIMSMFDKAKCKVKWKGLVGGNIDSEFGVLQGGMLSPKLFTEFLTDLHNYLSAECGVLMSNMVISYILFADDLILCSETPEGLQKLIDGLFNYCSKWHLILSFTKTKVMVFNTRKVNKHVFTFNNQDIEIVKEYKYVGTIFSSNTKNAFRKNTAHLIEKARKAMFGLNCHIKDSVGYLPPDLSIKMFDKQIKPILDYASEICYMGKQDYDLEKVHLCYLKYLLNVKPSSCTPSIYAECGRFPLVIKQKVQALKYWKRLLKSDKKTVICNAYNSLFVSFEGGQVNWCTYIKDILMEVDMNETWERQCITNIQINIIKNKLHEQFTKKTMNDILNTDKFPKLRTYKLFKTDFRLENHLLTLENRGHQIALSKFRISSHNLRIETGRYETNPSLEPHDRLCIFCDNLAVEDEFHFLLECPQYMVERLSLIRVCQVHIENFENLEHRDKFIEIVKNKKPTVIAALAKYIYSSMLKRSKLDPNLSKSVCKSKSKKSAKNR